MKECVRVEQGDCSGLRELRDWFHSFYTLLNEADNVKELCGIQASQRPHWLLQLGEQRPRNISMKGTDSTYQHFQVFGAHTYFMRLHFMAHLGIDIWEPNPRPSCSRKAGMKTSLMSGHVDTSYSGCFVGFGWQEGRGSMCLWSFTPCFPFCYDLGRSVSLPVWFKFQIKLWQWAVPSQGMVFLLFRDPDKHHQGWCAQTFKMTPGLMHDVISWACDALWWLLCHVSFLSEPKKPSRANQDSKPALPDTNIARDELFLPETPLFLTVHLSPGS